MSTANALNINTQTISGINYPDINGSTGITVTKSGGTITLEAGGSGGFLVANNNLSDVTSVPGSNSNLFNLSQRTVTTNTTLTSADYGSMIIVDNTLTSVTLTLPAFTGSNKYIDIYYPHQFTSPPIPFFTSVSIQSPDVPFRGLGNTLLAIGPGDYVRIMQSPIQGSFWNVIESSLQPQDFLVKMTGTPALLTGIPTIIPYNNVVRDTTNGGFSTAGFRFFPLSPGLYEFYHYSGFSMGYTSGNTQSNFQLVENFGVPQVLTSQNSGLFNDLGAMPGVANKTEYFVDVTGLSTKTFAIIGLQNSGNIMNLDTTNSFFGGRRVSLW